MPSENTTTTKQPLTNLNVVVKHDMPRDELWVHPSMFDLLQCAFMEAESNRTLKGIFDAG